jgi:2-haloacid dehalogenase
MVGDSPTSDIGAAKAAGVASCWLNPKRKIAPKELAPDYDIASLDQLYDILGLEKNATIM